MDKLKMKTPDLVDENIANIAKLFPNTVTEVKDENGNTKPAIDFDLLKQQLSSVLVEGRDERYCMDWPGKNKALLKANTPIKKTLRPCIEDSVDFENTENLYIEGDNFEVLKILQESYLNKVKMIYIDPPYNTGNDFIYKDDFKVSKDEYDEETGAINDDGDKMFKNTDSSGRYHSDWLNMMYERLIIARDLLKDDGVIFISIDDNEVANLRKICDEIFGEENFVANVIWERAFAPINLKKHFSESHDHILVYSKFNEKSFCNGLPRSKEGLDRYKNVDNDIRGVWQSDNFSVGPAIAEKIYEIITPGGRKVLPPDGRCWLLTKKRYIEFINDNRIWFGTDGNNVPRIKRFLSEVKNRVTPMTIWKHSEVGHSQDASQKLKKLFNGKAFFTYPKPIDLIKRILELYSNDNDLILDFFSGSATTAHAVMQLNAEDGGNRKFIMVQVLEKCDEKSEAFKAGFATIAEIGKERIRRAGKQIIVNGELLMVNGKKKKDETPDLFDSDSAETAKSKNKLDTGFRVYKVASTNMKKVYYHPTELDQRMLNGLADNIKEGRTSEDLLTQVILDLGLELNLPIETKTILGKTVYIVQTNALVACFDDEIDVAMIDEIAKLKPFRAVFKDGSFIDDATGINVNERFKNLSPDTKINVI